MRSTLGRAGRRPPSGAVGLQVQLERAVVRVDEGHPVDRRADVELDSSTAGAAAAGSVWRSGQRRGRGEQLLAGLGSVAGPVDLDQPAAGAGRAG